MRAFLAAAMIASIATTALAQDAGTGRQGHAHMRKDTDQKKKTDDTNAPSPLAGQPDQPFDPWRNMRSVETPKGDKTPN